MKNNREMVKENGEWVGNLLQMLLNRINCPRNIYYKRNRKTLEKNNIVFTPL